jgi:hypothetical protein
MKGLGLFEGSFVVKYLEHVLLKGRPSKYPATTCLAAEVLGGAYSI